MVYYTIVSHFEKMLLKFCCKKHSANVVKFCGMKKCVVRRQSKICV